MLSVSSQLRFEEWKHANQLVLLKNRTSHKNGGPATCVMKGSYGMGVGLWKKLGGRSLVEKSFDGVSFVDVR